MSYLVKIYVGCVFDKDANKLGANTVNKAINSARQKLSVFYGGCSVYKAQGSYVMEDGRLCNENCRVIEVTVTNIQHDKLKLVCNELKLALNQESVMLNIQPLTLSEFI